MGRKDVNYFKPTDKGYEYIGSYYRFRLGGAEPRKRNVTYIVLAFMMLAAFLAMGVLDRGMTRQIYVALPYVASLLPIGLCISAAVALPSIPENMTIVQYRRGPKRLMNCARGALVTGAMTVVGGAISAARGAFSTGDVPFIVGGICLVICAAAIVRMYRDCPAEEVVGRPGKTIVDYDKKK
jgi:hypothetical protein